MNCVYCGEPSGEGLLCAKCASQHDELTFSSYTLIGDTLFTEARGGSGVHLKVGPTVGGNVGFEALPSLSEEIDIVGNGLERGKRPDMFTPRIERMMVHTGIPEELEADAELLITKEGADGANRMLALTEEMRQDKKVRFSPRLENLLGNTAWLCNPVLSSPRSMDADIRSDTMLGLSESVLAYYDRSLEADPGNQAALRNSAIVLHSVSREKDCIETCTEYLKKDAKEPDIWCLKGAALMNVGEIEDALRSYDHALRLAPRNHNIWTRKGLALLGLGRFPESIMCFDHSIKLEPHNPEAYDGKGDALTKLGQIDTAVEAYDLSKSFIPRPTFIRRTDAPLATKKMEPELVDELPDMPEPDLDEELPEELDDLDVLEEDIEEEGREAPVEEPDAPMEDDEELDELDDLDDIEEQGPEQEMEEPDIPGPADIEEKKPEPPAPKPKSLAEALAGGFDDDDDDEFPEFVDIPMGDDEEEEIMPEDLTGAGPDLPGEEKEPDDDPDASRITEEIGVEELKVEEELEEALIEGPELEADVEPPTGEEEGQSTEEAMSKVQQLMDEEDYEAALFICDLFLKENPENTQILAMRGGLLISQGRTDEALETFDRSLGIDPDDADSLINKATAFDEADDYGKAIRIYDKILEQDPRNLDALLRKGQSQIQLDNFEEAIVSFNGVIEIDSENIDAWLGIGDGFFGLGRPDDAYKCFDKVSEIQPDEAEAWAKKADVLMEKGRWGGALQFYDRAISLDKEYDYPYLKKAELLMVRRKYDDANEVFSQVLKFSPTDVDALCGRTEILIKTGKWGAALQNLKGITRLHSDNSKAWSLTGDAYRMDGHIEDAKNAYDKALELDTKSADAMVGKGLLMLKHGGFNESVKLFRKALEYQPEDSTIWRHLGNAQKETGKEKEAIRSLEKAVEMGNHITENWLSLGIALHEIGRYADAINSFDKVLKLNPDFEKARKWRQQSIKRLGRDN